MKLRTAIRRSTPGLVTYRKHAKGCQRGHLFFDNDGPCVINLEACAAMLQKDLDINGRLLAHSINHIGEAADMLAMVLPMVEYFHEREGCPSTLQALLDLTEKINKVK